MDLIYALSKVASTSSHPPKALLSNVFYSGSTPSLLIPNIQMLAIFLLWLEMGITYNWVQLGQGKKPEELDMSTIKSWV